MYNKFFKDITKKSLKTQLKTELNTESNTEIDYNKEINLFDYSYNDTQRLETILIIKGDSKEIIKIDKE